MIVSLDPASSVPVYEQLIGQIQRLIASGRLPVGTRLPTIRQLASDLVVAPATISRVYDALASDGWVVGQRRRGTVVANRPPTAPLEEDLGQAMVTVAQAGKELGLGRDALHDLLDQSLDRLET